MFQIGDRVKFTGEYDRSPEKLALAQSGIVGTVTDAGRFKPYVVDVDGVEVRAYDRELMRVDYHPPIELYQDLTLSHLSEEQIERSHSMYTWIVQNRWSAHTAFRTREALYLWAEQRGLRLPEVEPGNWSKIGGRYATVAHMNEAAFYSLDGELIRVLSNAQYTLGIVTTDDSGMKTVHELNPNVHSRPIFDHWVTDPHYR